MSKTNKYLNTALVIASILMLSLLKDPILEVTHKIGGILSPFLIAFGLAFVLQPLVRLFERKLKIKRIFAQLLVLIFIALLFAYLVINVAPLVVNQTTSIIQEIEKGLKSLIDYIGRSNIEKYFGGFSEEEFLNIIKNYSGIFIQKIASAIPSLMLIPIIFLYFFFGYDNVKKSIMNVLLKYKMYKLYAYFTKLEELTVIYLGGLALTITILSIGAAVSFTLIGLDKGITLGILVGISTIIPYFGAWISGAFAVVIALGSSLKLAIITILVIVGVQTIEGNIITPNIQAKSFSLHPLVILLAIAVFSSLFGFAGMLLAIPLLIATKLFYTMFIEEKIIEEREKKIEQLEKDKEKYNL